MLPATQNTFCYWVDSRIELLSSLQFNLTGVHLKPEHGHLPQIDLVRLFRSVTKRNCCSLTRLNKSQSQKVTRVRHNAGLWKNHSYTLHPYVTLLLYDLKGSWIVPFHFRHRFIVGFNPRQPRWSSQEQLFCVSVMMFFLFVMNRK